MICSPHSVILNLFILILTLLLLGWPQAADGCSTFVIGKGKTTLFGRNYDFFTGTGFIVIVGLPNATVLRVRSCQQTGGTRWCKVSLDRAPGLKGYVSWAYLRKL